MNREQQMVRNFHEKFNLPIRSSLDVPTAYDRFCRARLIVEEAAEFTAAAQQGDLVEMADALADLLYVTYGAVVAFGIDLERIFEVVHAANMCKHAAKDAGGKVTKPKGWQPPDVKEALHVQGWPR